MRMQAVGRVPRRLWMLASLTLGVVAASQTAGSPAWTASLRLANEPVAFRTSEVDYLRVDGKTFQATVYQPDGPGPFPAILDVHGGAWTREDVRRDEHAVLNRALATMGMVVVAIDFGRLPSPTIPPPSPT